MMGKADPAMSAADYIFGIALIVVIAASLYLGPRIKRDRIAMQWGFDGRPTWQAPKRLRLWAMVPLMLAVRLLIWLGATYAPRSTHRVELGIAAFSAIACASHIFILKKAQRANASSVGQADGN
jgi:hypothetical protein